MGETGASTGPVPPVALDLVADAVLVVADGVVKAANPAVSRLLGHDPTEVVGRTTSELLRPVDASDERLVADVLGGAVGVTPPVGLVGGDGRHLVVRIRGDSRDGSGVVVLEDVTEQVEAQGVLAALQQRLADLQELGRIGLWTWDPERDEMQWTGALYEMHGTDPLDFAGTLAAHVAPVPMGRREDVLTALEAARDGTEVELEYPIVRPDGEERTLWSRVAPAAGPRPAVTGIVQDVTVAHRARQHVERLNAQLERFVSAVSHDLREPLGMIASYAALLLEDEVSGEEAEHFVHRIRANAQAAAEQVRELLSEARAVAAAEPVEQVDLADVVAWTGEVLHAELASSGSTLEYGELPIVDGRPAQLRQVLLNLVGNAVKYRRPGRPAHVHVGARTTDDGWEVWVDDDGPGIPESEREAVFQVGYRAVAVRDGEVPGTGIGLATVFGNVVDGHGGTIELTDSPRGGARVVFTLPRRRGREEDR